MNKIICQNCYNILGNREKDEFGEIHVRANYPGMETIGQPVTAECMLVTLGCPKCGCLVQVKI